MSRLPGSGPGPGWGPAWGPAGGQSSIEYLVILACVVGVVVAVPDGALHEVIAALGRAYSRFTEGVSRP